MLIANVSTWINYRRDETNESREDPGVVRNRDTAKMRVYPICKVIVIANTWGSVLYGESMQRYESSYNELFHILHLAVTLSFVCTQSCRIYNFSFLASKSIVESSCVFFEPLRAYFGTRRHCQTFISSKHFIQVDKKNCKL